MTALSSSQLLSKTPSGCALRPVDKCLMSLVSPSGISFRHARKSSSNRSPLSVQAGYSDGGKPSDASIFVSGFILGGLAVGTLGCIFAPQISKALAGTDRKDLMKKLPKFIYDEEKALERQRKILTEKIDQLNSSIDEISNQLQSDDNQNEAAINLDEVDAFA